MKAASMGLTCHAQTDPGLRRPVNEDSYCARPDLGLFVVADGLGGHPGGHVASRMVAEAIFCARDQAPPSRTLSAIPSQAKENWQ